jgi:hypothetical protein
MNEQQLLELYRELAGQMLQIGHRLDEAKRQYDYLVSQAGGEPPWGGGAQVLESLRTTIQTTNLVALQNLLYHNSGE